MNKEFFKYNYLLMNNSVFSLAINPRIIENYIIWHDGYGEHGFELKEVKENSTDGSISISVIIAEEQQNLTLLPLTIDIFDKFFKDFGIYKKITTEIELYNYLDDLTYRV